MKKNDNRGMTLVELLVVIAIIAVLAGVLGLSVAAISKQKLKDAAYETKQMIQMAQLYSKSRDDCRLVFSGHKNGNVIETKVTLYDKNGPGNTDRVVKEITINSKIKVEMTAESSGGGTMTLPLGIKSVEIPINRSTGGFGVCPDFHGLKNSTVTRIYLRQGNKDITLKLATYTGHVSVEY